MLAIAALAVASARSAFYVSIMAKDNTATIAGIGVLVGLGLLAAALSSAKKSPDRRTEFTDRLRDSLLNAGINLIGAELGRNDEGPVWVVTVELATSNVVTLHAQVAAPSADPFASQTCDEISARIIGRFAGGA